MRASEKGFRHDAPPEAFAAAMTKCEGWAPSCSDYQQCLRGGSCFAAPAHLVAARMIEKILPAADQRDGLHFAYLIAAAQALRDGEIYL